MWFKVELAGVEPASRQGSHMLSTCLSCLICREVIRWQAAESLLISCYFTVKPEKPRAIPELRALPYRVGTGPHRPGNVSSQHLVPGLSIIRLSADYAARA